MTAHISLLWAIAEGRYLVDEIDGHPVAIPVAALRRIVERGSAASVEMIALDDEDDDGEAETYRVPLEQVRELARGERYLLAGAGIVYLVAADEIGGAS